MRSVIFAGVLLLVLSLAGAEAPKSFGASWTGVKQAAVRGHKLIYLHFTTTWCTWCRRIEQDTYTDPTVQKALAADFVAASLDCTKPEQGEPSKAVRENLALLARFGGEGFPHLVMLSEDGTVVLNAIPGYRPPEQFLKDIEQAKASWKEYQEFQQYTKTADLEGYEYAARAMGVYQRTRQPELAVKMARQVRALDPDNAKGGALDALGVLLGVVPPADWPVKCKDELAAVARFDPQNERGALERTEWTLAYARFQLNDNAAAIAALTKLTNAAKGLQEPQQVYGLLGVAQARAGDAAAAATLEKAIAIAPDSQLGQWLAEQLKNLKARAN